jgi:hypothetical protein
MRLVGLGLLSIALCLAAPARAWPKDPPPRPLTRATRLHFDLPAVDARENLTLGFWPSMRQSMAITTDTFYALHAAIMAVPYPRALPNEAVAIFDYATIGVADVLMLWVPGGNGWMHEEWHRAVMSRRGVRSHDDMYDFPFFRDLINVSDESDADLIRLKREHPVDQIRMSSAGIEGDFRQGLEFDRDRFFFGTRAATLFEELFNTANAIGYMQTAAFGSEPTTEEENEKEGTNVTRRDFTGLDPDGWVYDLFRPDEPYEARGVHPSGVGIDRYRSSADFTPRELHYLQAQARLSFLNLANPNFLGFYEFKAGELLGAPFSFNASLSHVMAPFGYSLGMHLYAKTGGYKAYAELRTYVSESLVLPGITAELVRYPLGFFNASLTPRVRLWLQPRSQRFFAHAASPGASLEARVNVPIVPSFDFYLEAEGKSRGWVPGNVFLDQSLNVRSGFEAFVF